MEEEMGMPDGFSPKMFVAIIEVVEDNETSEEREEKGETELPFTSVSES